MLNSLTKSLPKDADLPNSTENLIQEKFQHGIQHRHIIVRRPILLDVPAETLACITAYLDPPSLLSVAQVNTYLSHHVNDENTWQRAFICQFLGVGPQLDINNKNTVLLRRSETSWRKEFLVRYKLRRRWERSRNGSTTHIPVHSTISGMHQMVSNGLLTSSVEYGIVARSIPLTGKILSGYLDASGSATGPGTGNPNAEFTPNISACGLASNGGTAKLVWGSRVGDVLFMSVSKAMETGSRRSAAEVKRCSVADEHEGAVVDAVWLNAEPGWVLTGGADGRVKVWDAKNATSVWASQQVFDSIIPDSCVKVAGSVQHGVVLGVFKSGDIRIWQGFDFTQSTILADKIKEIVVDNPIRTSTEGYDSSINHGVTTLDCDSSANHLSVLAGYENDCYFYRIQVDLSTSEVQTLAFGEPCSGPFSTIAPFFCTDETECSVILAGDHLGNIRLYDWNADPHYMNTRTNAIGPLKQFEAHGNGASVTSIAWNGLVLVSGSVRGDVNVFDGMTFELLRKFESPHPPSGRRGVGTTVGEIEAQREREKVRILLLGPEKDVVFMGIGDKVAAWKAGPVPKYIRSGVRSRNVSSWGRGKRLGQNLKRFDYLSQDIIESQDIMDDETTFSARAQRARGREYDQREGLASLGLSEVEAVEYVLMLSRDEANDRGSANSGAADMSSRHEIDEGIFEGDFDGGAHRLDDGDWGSGRLPSSMSTISPNSGVGISSTVSSNSSGSSASLSSGRSSATTSLVTHGIGLGHPIPGAARVMGMPRFSPSSSSSTTQKVQISPRETAEPLEAGMEWREENRRGEIEEGRGMRLVLEDHHFPPVGNVDERGTDGGDSRLGTPSPRSNRKNTSVPPRSAWSIPLTKKLSLSPSNLRVDTADRMPDTSTSSRSAGSSGPAVASGSARVSPTTSRSSICDRAGGINAALRVVGVEDQDGSGMDEDLRFALEMSLAEAKSTKEDV